jgi:Endonuclease-reverse transcriptase
MRQHIQEQNYNAIIMTGDFNLHHPLWNAQDYDIHDAQGDELIEMMADAGLKLLLPACTTCQEIISGEIREILEFRASGVGTFE